MELSCSEMNVSLFNFIGDRTDRNARYCHSFNYTRENQLTGEDIASLDIRRGFLISSLETRRTKRKNRITISKVKDRWMELNESE